MKDHAGPKHRDRPYQSGRSKHRIKVKNRKHDAFDRVQEAHRRGSPAADPAAAA